MGIVQIKAVEAPVRCSIKTDQGGTSYTTARVSVLNWEGGSHAVLFMVPLGSPGAKPGASATATIRVLFLF